MRTEKTRKLPASGEVLICKKGLSPVHIDPKNNRLFVNAVNINGEWQLSNRNNNYGLKCLIMPLSAELLLNSGRFRTGIKSLTVVFSKESFLICEVG